MKPLTVIARWVVLSAVLWALAPASAWACAACYGQSDSPMAQGMNWGIFTLLGCIGMVLAGVGAFAFYLARRGAATPVAATQAPTSEAPASSWMEATTKV